MRLSRRFMWSASRSRVTSWLPTMSRVRSTTWRGRSSSAMAWLPSSRPSLSAGMRRMPSARVSEVMAPAPRFKGVATTRCPTRPRCTRRNSSCPSLEGSLRPTLTSMVWRWGGLWPCMR